MSTGKTTKTAAAAPAANVVKKIVAPVAAPVVAATKKVEAAVAAPVAPPVAAAKKIEAAVVAPAPIAPPVVAVAKKVEEVVAVQHEAAKAVVKASVDTVTQTVEKAVKVTKEHVDTAVKKGTAALSGVAAFKGYEEIVQFGKDNVDALVQSNSIVARGFQDLSRSVATLVQASFEESLAASKTLFGAKSFKEVIDLSSSLAKSNIEKLVAEGSKIGQASAKLAEEALGPINSRVEAVVEKLTKTAA